MLALLPVIAATPLRLTADPSMSDVSLTGEWAAQTQRNQDALPRQRQPVGLSLHDDG